MERTNSTAACQAWYHVMNRGVARRTVFEGRRDVEEFLDGVRLVREEHLMEVHAYCLMTTHFHLLVRSTEGGLPKAMMLLLNRYSRWFNRIRRRDGPLWRGRYQAKLIESHGYWSTLVRYIDYNPVHAGMTNRPRDYPFGSAWYYGQQGVTSADPTPWLCRDEVEWEVREALDVSIYDPAAYPRVFGEPLSESEAHMLDRDESPRIYNANAFDDLVGRAPGEVQRWMVRKARLADGRFIQGPALLAPKVIGAALRQRRTLNPHGPGRPSQKAINGWDVLEAGLLRAFSGLNLQEIGHRMTRNTSTVGRWSQLHQRWILESREYASVASELVAILMNAEHAGIRSPGNSYDDRGLAAPRSGAARPRSS